MIQKTQNIIYTANWVLHNNNIIRQYFAFQIFLYVISIMQNLGLCNCNCVVWFEIKYNKVITANIIQYGSQNWYVFE